MSDMRRITLPQGPTLTVTQLYALNDLLTVLAPAHWHMNECGCCLTVHGRDCAYVVDDKGGETFFAERGCACGESADAE